MNFSAEREEMREKVPACPQSAKVKKGVSKRMWMKHDESFPRDPLKTHIRVSPITF